MRPLIEEIDRSLYRLGGSRPQGFAAWPKEKRQRIAVRGGRAAHALGRAHKFTSEEAREAGRKGVAMREKRRRERRESRD